MNAMPESTAISSEESSTTTGVPHAPLTAVDRSILPDDGPKMVTGCDVFDVFEKTVTKSQPLSVENESKRMATRDPAGGARVM